MIANDHEPRVPLDDIVRQLLDDGHQLLGRVCHEPDPM
jgi:hypothetical protein